MPLFTLTLLIYARCLLLYARCRYAMALCHDVDCFDMAYFRRRDAAAAAIA